MAVDALVSKMILTTQCPHPVDVRLWISSLNNNFGSPGNGNHSAVCKNSFLGMAPSKTWPNWTIVTYIFLDCVKRYVLLPRNNTCFGWLTIEHLMREGLLFEMSRNQRRIVLHYMEMFYTTKGTPICNISTFRGTHFISSFAYCMWAIWNMRKWHYIKCTKFIFIFYVTSVTIILTKVFVLDRSTIVETI